MADSSVLLEVVLEGKNIKVVQKQIDGVTKSINKQTAARDTQAKKTNAYQRQEKGTAQITSNSTKAFAKQAQTIEGGLVPAYATLAANVFAISAAFNVLRQNAALTQLEQGLERTGTVAGKNLGFISDKLKEITGDAISTRASLEAVALGTSAGFESSQIEELTKVAKGASLALGRDLEDALNRLVRGTAKLEPEILDELGIMVRLDDAVSDYADSLGKLPKQLTQAERRQAFLNATITQGIKKFGDISQSVDPNPYDQLAAAFRELSDTGLKLANNVLTPLIRFLSETPTALAGVLALFASSIIDKIVPAINIAIERQRLLARVALQETIGSVKKQAAEYTKQAKSLPTFAAAPKSVKLLEDQMRAGTLSAKDLTTAVKNLKKSEQLRQVALKNHSAEKKVQKQAELDQIRQLRIATEQLIAAENRRFTLGAKGEAKRAKSRLAGLQAASLQKIDQTGAFGGFGVAFASIGKQGKKIGQVTGLVNTLSTSLTVARNGAILLGRAFLNFIPIIGQILSIGSLLFPLLKGLFEKSKVQQAADSAAKSFDSFSDISYELGKALKDSNSETENFTRKSRVLVNIIGQVKDGISSLGVAIKESRTQQIAKLREDFLNLSGDAGFFAQAYALAVSGVGVVGIDKELKRIEENIDSLLSKGDTLDAAGRQAASQILQRAIDRIGDNENLSSLMATQVKSLKIVKNGLDAGAELSAEQIENFLEGLRKKEKAFTDAIDNAAASYANFTKAARAAGDKSSTPFDRATEGLQGFLNEAKAASEVGGIGIDAFFEQAAGSAEYLQKLASEGFITGDTDVKRLESLQEKLDGVVSTYQTIGSEIKGLQTDQKNLNKFVNNQPLVLEKSLDLTNTIIDREIEKLETEREGYDLLNLSEAQKERIDQIDAQIIAKGKERISQEEITARVNQEQLKAKQEILGLEQKIFASKKATLEAEMELARVQYKLQRLADTGSEELSPIEELNFFLKEKENRKKILLEEFNLKTKAIDLEYDLLEAKFEIIKAQAKANGVELSNTGRISQLLSEGRSAAQEAAKKEYDLALKRLELEEQVLRKRAEQDSPGFTKTAEFINQVGEGITRGKATIEVAGRDKESADKEVAGAKIDLAIGRGMGDSAEEIAKLEEALEKAKSKAKDAGKSLKQAFINATLEGIQPMLNKLRELGPNGELVAAISEGTLVMSSAFIELSKETNTAADKIAAVGAIVSSIGNIMAASSEARIAGIDKEIEAEKKRDGKSKESLSKIQALEKKKDRAKRKQFEQNKKISMAEAVIQGSLAIVKALAEGGPILGPILAAAIGALTAAQLAIISSTTYQGGSSSGGTSVPRNISVGERSNKVDVAQQATGSELAGLRGGDTRKIGGMPTSAFMGAKYRAEGGPTAGYVVGEQGPELFVPETPGRIVPNDEMKQAQPVNVNFNVQAIDASSFNDALTTQRGNIISMIREAANTYGETFLEGVNDSAINAGGGKI